MNVLHKLTSEATTTNRPAQARRARDPIIATITGSDSAVALGITVRSTSPLFCLCRALLRAGADSNRPLHAFRGDVLALTIRTLADGARLEVNQHGTGFAARRERRAAPSIAATAAAHTERPGCAARGVVVPVLVDEFGAIIDGHNRTKGHWRANSTRCAGHLSRQHVRLIADQLRDTPDWADRRISRELGVDHKTVRCSAWEAAKSPRHPFSVTPSCGERRSMTRGATARRRQLEQWHTEKR